MKEFMGEDFLLSTETAKKLYHGFAENMPIVDYHCHISPAEIAENRVFENITQAWLGGDHYKWRLMRSNGVDERFITGDASDREKFQAFAELMPKAIGNPMYHWCHLELKRYFGCEKTLSGETAEEIWNFCNEKLKNLPVREIIRRSHVDVIVTTDDPVDSLSYHKQLKEDSSFATKVLPAFRPDKAVNIEKDGFPEYMAALEKAAGLSIHSMESLYKALSSRMDHFEAMGCRASDHGINEVAFAPASEEELDAILRKRLQGGSLSQDEERKYSSAVLLFLGREYARRGWVMEIHYGTSRNTNSRMFQKLGPDTGFDCIRSGDCASGLLSFLDTLEGEGKLPKTILFSLNPNDNAMLGSVIGCFQGTEAAGKIQHGAAWWFNDSKTGMTEQLTNLANLSLLGNFVGMLTDSRSFLSYTRHEYFRRILCELLGSWVENGEYPADWKALQELTENICYKNAIQYFGY